MPPSLNENIHYYYYTNYQDRSHAYLYFPFSSPYLHHSQRFLSLYFAIHCTVLYLQFYNV